MNYIDKYFSEYIKADCNRSLFIQKYLSANGVSSSVLSINGKNHIYVQFPSTQYNAQFRIKTVVSHYDRVENSQGANDNSAANFSLMNWAIKLNKRKDFHNVRLLFTDGEEITSGGVVEQGSFSIAAIFKKQGIKNDDVYVFDCMGRGTIPILCKTLIPLSTSYDFRKQFFSLEERAENLLRASGTKRWLKLPFAYSDNAGFIACGIPSVAITMLPDDEATQYLSSLMKEKNLEDYVLNRKLNFGDKNITKEKLMKLDSMLPQTWKFINTKYDTEYSLTKESFTVFEKILDSLANEKTIV